MRRSAGDTGDPVVERLEGTLDAVTPGSLTLVPDTGDAVTVAFDDVVEGRVMLPW